MTEYSAFLKHLGIDKKQMLASMLSKIPESEKPSKRKREMTKEELVQKIKDSDYTCKGINCYECTSVNGFGCCLQDDRKLFVYMFLSKSKKGDKSPEHITELEKEKCELLGIIQDKVKVIQELQQQIEQLQKINSEQKETLKKVRVALIQERAANIMNYGKGGVEMFDSLFEPLKGVSD